MIPSGPIYETYNGNTLCVNQDVFLFIGIATLDQFQKWVQRKKLVRVRTKGNGRTGLIKYDSIPPTYLQKIKKHFGDPYQKENVDSFLNRLQNDDEAAIFYAKAGLSPEKEYQHYIEAQILNLYGVLLQEIDEKKARNSSFKITEAKRTLSKVVNELKTIKLPNDKQKFPHKLPSNPRSLERRYYEYKEGSYATLIHGNEGNVNGLKIKGKIADFILAHYALPNKPTVLDVWTRYEAERAAKKWPKLDDDTIYKWLMKPVNRKKWFLGRHGKAAWINEYGHKISRDKSDWFPNCYLAIDGSKLDWIHYKKGANYNMGADLKHDIVFDVYSEKILGFYCGLDHENYTQHFHAFKMAMGESLQKPALITYDNQGGHKMEEMQDLYDRVIATNGEHYPHRALEHGSPVEQIFKRFQQQVLNKVYWSDKQAVTVRTEDSRPNMEFVKRHRDKLKTIDELIAAFSYYVEKWNAMEHPKFPGQSRNEVYQHESQFELERINELDMMRLFWITSKDALTYTSTGFTPTIRKETYHFEVYDLDGNVDLDFRDKYTGCKFHYQYDPNQLDNYIRLYLRLPNGDTKYVADAEPIKKVKGIPALMDDHDRNRKHKMLHVRDEELKRIEAELEALRHRTNITEESLIKEQDLELKFRGNIPKQIRETAEAGEGSWVNKY
ncbi:hypothetical protein EI546_06395 [Aequorivita sp. H23M31]|uniref:Integrase catalytic domain-containing protein n=1 Tax=Aequorivita ciconiae TaxID=2494375 RepID=A0A410G2A7_9FLAO|nr:hypothetical protein [Aequorivita sp. H23M31]QAA81379.1 hypothetical protein EI546_06395 [Aequorivita sp. H23M31]